MATLTANVAFDMDVEFGSFSGDSDGEITSITTSQVVYVDGSDRTIYYGDFELRGGKIASGTFTGIKDYAGSTLRAALGNTNVDVNDYVAYAQSNDALGLTQHFFRGADTFQGSAFADKLYGWNGNDIVRGGGGNDRLFGGSGNDSLNGGTGVDSLSGNYGNDTYTLADNDTITEVSGQGNDTVVASITYTLAVNVENLTLTGSSVINGIGNTLGNIIIGNAAVNILNGGIGNDTLNGGTGNDTLIGAAGNDRLTGGIGADKFRFNASLSANSNVNTVTDFSTVSDFLQLENAIFKKLTVPGVLNAFNFKANATGTATDSNDFILYETDTGKLSYDADGNGAGAKVQFGLIGTSTHAALTAADFVVI